MLLLSGALSVCGDFREKEFYHRYHKFNKIIGVHMEKIVILAPAKINLFLNVGDRREDGYHDIETVMQTLTLFDRLEVCKTTAKRRPSSTSAAAISWRRTALATSFTAPRPHFLPPPA